MITILSLAWNKYDMTKVFLEKLKRYTDIPHHLVFTDNNSSDPIPALVKEYYPKATLIVKERNVGCPATRNEAMSHVNTDITFWLDNDTMVGPNWYSPILRKLEDPSIGVSGPTGCVVKHPFDPGWPFEAKEVGDCDYFVGYLMGFKTKLYQPINDYNLPVNLDDVEACWGVKKNGGRAVISEPCFVQHLTSQTERGWGAESPIDKLWSNWPDKSIFVNYENRC